MKICNICKKSKPLDEYFKNTKAKSGKQSQCKKCHQKEVVYRLGGVSYTKFIADKFRDHPSPKTVALKYITIIKNRVKHDKRYENIENLLSKADLEGYLAENWESFMEMHKVWTENNCRRKWIPTIDRINPEGHYEIGNIQLLTLSENCKKGWRMRILRLKKDKQHA